MKDEEREREKRLVILSNGRPMLDLMGYYVKGKNSDVIPIFFFYHKVNKF